MLDFVNSQLKTNDLFQNVMNQNNSNPLDKYDVETETSWFTMSRNAKLSNEKILDFFNQQTDLDRMLGMAFPTQTATQQPIQVISTSIWFSDDFVKEMSNLDVEGILKTCTEFNKLCNSNRKSGSSSDGELCPSNTSRNYLDSYNVFGCIQTTYVKYAI
uniref:Uncharacterized protein n=1 Tax=Trichobilharzia regenti TaxID=157069 RepID=A0AA85KD99_TRIRE|nr:unnamed protein product [Trichobilharzia regenti]